MMYRPKGDIVKSFLSDIKKSHCPRSEWICMDRHELFTFGLVGWICDPSSNPLKIPKNKIKRVEVTQKIRHKCLRVITIRAGQKVSHMGYQDH